MTVANALDLWSSDFKVNILTPKAILEAQVSALKKKAGDYLTAEVRTDYPKAELIQYSLDVTAPLLAYYRVTVLIAWHDRDLVYPVTVKSRGIENNEPFAEHDERIAATQEEFIDSIAEALQSKWVRSLVQSLIAQSSEAMKIKSPEKKD